VSPIADLMKSDVYALGQYLQIPESIQKAAPTDGLFGDNRTDEDQLGASYEELEWAMLEDEKGNSSDNFSGREKEAFDIYKRLNLVNKHKMESIPICEIPDNSLYYDATLTNWGNPSSSFNIIVCYIIDRWGVKHDMSLVQINIMLGIARIQALE